MDYIDRQAAIDDLLEEHEMLNGVMDEYLAKGMPIMRANTKIERNRIENDIFILNQLPSADVVDVVRCKDCKHRRAITWADGTEHWECVYDSGDPDEQSRNAEDDDWFCADGEAKDGGEP